MRHSTGPLIRNLLRVHADGLTLSGIAGHLNAPKNAVRRSLQTMPDAYIDRWARPVQGPFTAVWCVVVPPANCPHPNGPQV